ncbi:unnamed protein product, partial [Effrenium voratum]
AETQLPEAHIADVSIFAPETIPDDTLDKVTKPADTKPRTLTDALLARSESDQSCPTLMLGQSVVNKQIGSNVPKDLAALPSPEE